jgi:Domain of unknown function (DUF4279)
MNTALALATSTTRSRKIAPQKVFATLRFSGDRLDPERISDILRVRPTKSYRKGERHLAGSRAGHLVARTGIWLLATDDYVASADLNQHLGYLASLISRGPGPDEDRLAPLRELMARDGITAHLSCFWHGERGEQPPSIPPEATAKLRGLPADIEMDFDTD